MILIGNAVKTPCFSNLHIWKLWKLTTSPFRILRVYNSLSFGHFEQEVDSKFGSCTNWDAWNAINQVSFARAWGFRFAYQLITIRCQSDTALYGLLQSRPSCTFNWIFSSDWSGKRRGRWGFPQRKWKSNVAREAKCWRPLTAAGDDSKMFIPLWFCCSISSHQWFSISTFKSPIDMKGELLCLGRVDSFLETCIFYIYTYIYICVYIHTDVSRNVGMDSVRFLASKKKLQKASSSRHHGLLAPGVEHA